MNEAETPVAATPAEPIVVHLHHATEPGAVDISYGFVGDRRAIVIVIQDDAELSLVLRSTNLKSEIKIDSFPAGWRTVADDQYMTIPASGSDGWVTHNREWISRGYSFDKPLRWHPETFRRTRGLTE